MKGLVLIGLTPRGRRYARRDMERERERDMVKITRHLADYEFEKERSRRAQEDEKRAAEEAKQADKAHDRFDKLVTRMIRHEDEIQKQMHEEVIALCGTDPLGFEDDDKSAAQ